jgi:phage tail protein X
MPTSAELAEARRVDEARGAARSRQADAARSLHGLGQPASYTVQEGDTYESIAAATGGDAEAIYAANAGGAASTDPALLEPGTILALPAPAAGQEDANDAELSALTRAELNARAEGAGVANPEDLPNKQAVIDAIEAAER